MGGGRRLAAIGAIVLMIGCVLPWFTVGGDGGLPPEIYRAFDYFPGVVVFVTALATLALVLLPYAAGVRPLGIDRGLSFGILAIAALVGIALWLPAALPAPAGLLPDRAYGLWISVVGAIVMARAAFDIVREAPRF
ncbi:MAG: hypothetical protein WCK58_00045 [Chloroflexota bacterium]